MVTNGMDGVPCQSGRDPLNRFDGLKLKRIFLLMFWMLSLLWMKKRGKYHLAKTEEQRDRNRNKKTGRLRDGWMFGVECWVYIINFIKYELRGVNRYVLHS